MSLRATTFASRCAKSLSAAGHGHHTTSTSLTVGASSRSRRHSSSKASCPPGGSSGSERAADSIEKPVEEKRLTGRVSRRRNKDNAATLAAKATDEAFANLPHVPMTDNLAPMDIAFACFFSQHRPISVYHPIPQTYSNAHFDRIFETRPEPRSGKIKPQDVIYTLAGAVNAFEQASQSPEERAARSDLQEEDRSSMLNLEELVKQFRPFNVPQPPTPFDMSAGASEEAQARRDEAGIMELVEDEEPRLTQHMTYQTTVTIEETTSPEGDKTFTASATPIIVRNAAARTPRQPFLTRMAQRQMVIEPSNGEDEGMMLISVKRQRKLKMKKHKYKKLMKRTRNLRRKLGKT